MCARCGIGLPWVVSTWQIVRARCTTGLPWAVSTWLIVRTRCTIGLPWAVSTWPMVRTRKDRAFALALVNLAVLFREQFL